MIEAGALERLRAIIAAHTAGEMDELERLVIDAGEWIGELDEMKPESVSLPESDGGAGEGEKTRVASSGQTSIGTEAFISLWNAAKLVVSQGPNSRTLSDLEAAVAAAEPFVR